jgi:hypothetical protein
MALGISPQQQLLVWLAAGHQHSRTMVTPLLAGCFDVVSVFFHPFDVSSGCQLYV